MVVVGASGDLAKKKIYPALFALYVEGHLPEYFTIWGFARSKMSNEEFREYIGTQLSCRLSDKGKCEGKFESFLERCYYHPGQYNNRDDFAALSDAMKEPEKVLSDALPSQAVCSLLQLADLEASECTLSASCMRDSNLSYCHTDSATLLRHFSLNQHGHYCA